MKINKNKRLDVSTHTLLIRQNEALIFPPLKQMPPVSSLSPSLLLILTLLVSLKYDILHSGVTDLFGDKIFMC